MCATVNPGQMLAAHALAGLYAKQPQNDRTCSDMSVHFINAVGVR